MNYKIFRKTKEEITEEIVTLAQAYKVASDSARAKNHLCWEKCPVALCNTDVCPKVCDIYKKSLEDYSFINEGIQIVDENNEIKDFIVTDCELYNEEAPKVRVKK